MYLRLGRVPGLLGGRHQRGPAEPSRRSLLGGDTVAS
jgi:hypothetical protein